MSSVLPKPSGPHGVGFVDFEAECDGIQVLVRLYYPSKTEFDELSLASWLPSSSYFPSYGYYLRVPMILYAPVARFVMGGVKQWAVENAEPIDAFQGTVIFSHGLAGIRTTYSVICTELASQGYAAAAIEHRDGSASMTMTEGGKTVMPYKYIDAEVEDELAIRKGQLELRCREVGATIRSLQSYQLECLDFINSRMKFDEIVLMGHSFGAATMLKFASQSGLRCAVIALDPWMYAMPLEPLPLKRDKFDILVIDMEQFQWPENLAKIEAHQNYWAKEPTICTVINGSHQQVSDVPLLRFGSYMIKKGSPPTEIVLRVINQLSLIFILEKKIPHEIVSKFGELVRQM